MSNNAAHSAMRLKKIPSKLIREAKPNIQMRRIQYLRRELLKEDLIL